MPQEFAFTSAAMAAALEDTPVSYEDLAEIEREFDQVETEIIRQQLALTKPLYAQRSKTVAQIPNFWPLVIEQAPPDIDQYIQPSDSALLLSSLASLSVSHFEAELPHGDPRSVSIRFDFQENEYFRDASLEKRFWWRRAADGWTGLVSEPVPIDWKAGRDLTGGVLGLVVKAWEAERKPSSSMNGGGGGGGAAKDKKKKKKNKAGLTPEQKALKKHIDGTGMGGLSFFAWFGFIGRNITAEESAAANALEARRREARKAGSALDTNEDGDGENGEKAEGEDEAEDTEGEDEVDMSLEIFPEGDDLAVAISEDLWPSAIKYFTQAQEQDALSDADFESDDDEEEGGDEESAALSAGANSDADAELARPKKKQRSS